MQNQWIADRYEINGEIMQSDDGVWYRALDTSLNREVFILLIRPEARSYSEAFPQLFSEVGHVSNESFLQILNAGTNEEQRYVVFHARKGMPMYQYAERHAVKLQTTLRWVQTAGELLLQGERSGLPSFSVSFDNLWITENDEILVMNYWKEAVGSRTGTIGLSQLLYQLSTLHALAPRQYDIYASRVQSILKHDLPAQRDAVLALTKRVYESDVAVSEYVHTLEEIRERPHSFVKTAAPIAPIMEEHEEVKEERQAYTEPTAAPLVASEPPVPLSRTKTNHEPKADQRSNHSATESGNKVKAEESALSPEERSAFEHKESRSDRFKVGIMIAGIALFFTLLAGAVIWANSLTSDETVATTPTNEQQQETTEPGSEETAQPDNSTNMNETNETTDTQKQDTNTSDANNGGTTVPSEETETVPTPNTNNQEEQPVVPDVNQNEQPTTETDNGVQQPDPTVPTDPNNPDSTIVPPTGENVTPLDPNRPQPEIPAEGTAPNLVGLTLEEAEKLTKDAGLKYSFFKENHEGGEPNTIFKQEPEAGAAVKKGDRITFYVVRKAN
ncbi:Stk1 family PASTA domain-containing Ser/Thr kinase [Paenibacillus arenosi]|uniref:PASTA domain-containing protein n=1 Tax=Paenibacillus arenosi TaxID=2774142 RepID=A0ABR9ATE8_9BACL|nr:Stk1 family PASTA domain-containing Ser/Thr kinase [Paenibacillus arenosi]MBD8497171.1 PASTA domain-containing protein [Paenibacillus arenosi]